MYKKITLFGLILLQLLFANNNIYVYPENNPSRLSVTFRKTSSGNFTELLDQNVLYLGHQQGYGEAIIPKRFQDQRNSLFNFSKVYMPQDMEAQSIQFEVLLRGLETYDNEYYYLNIEENDKISATITDANNETSPGQLTIQNINSNDLQVEVELRTLTLQSFQQVLGEYISPEGEAWSREETRIVSDFFREINKENRPGSDFVRIKIGALDQVNESELRIRALSEDRNKMVTLGFDKVGNNEIKIPNLNYYQLNCWYKNQRRPIRKVFETKDFVGSRLIFNYVHDGEEGQYVKEEGESKIYLPYPEEKLSQLSCQSDGQRKSVTLNKDNTVDISEPIAVVIDLNSTRTTNKKNMYDYKNFIKKLIRGSNNTNIKVFKLLYTYPRPATFDKFKIDRVYTKFEDTKYATVNQDNAQEFIHWRREREDGTIDPGEIPESYFCIEEVTDMEFLDEEISTTIVKENMANQQYIKNFQNVLNRLNKERGYDFQQVYYVSYFPALKLYQLDGVEYKSFLKGQDSFSISSIKETK